MIKRTMSAFIAFALLAGCATNPDKIAPAPTATGCTNKADDTVALAKATDAQRKAAKNDVTTTILLGVPLSKVTGKDQSKEIARLKACVTR